ncbi:cation:proton antiporter [bacterium]|nr:cation:proton antiporter [bacterium]
MTAIFGHLTFDQLLTNTFIIFGIAILIGLFAGKLVAKIRFPLVSGYIFVGVLLGQSLLNIFSPAELEKLDLINDLALGFIAFIIGLEFSFPKLKQLGKTIIGIVFFEAFGAFIIVSISVFLFTKNVATALVLGAVASATAPAATVAVIKEVKARGDLTATILAVVACDDAVALIIYGFASSIAQGIFSSAASISLMKIAVIPLLKILLAFALGYIIALSLNYLIKRTRSDTELLIYLLAHILIVDGLATYFGLSELLSNMALGMFVINKFPKKEFKIKNTLDNFTPPILIAFFVLAGSRLNLKMFPKIWFISLIYFTARAIGKIFGASFGAKISHARKIVKKYIGFSLIPQIGVALALAIVIKRDFMRFGEQGAELANLAINILLFTTIITETIGPFLTKNVLAKANEINKGV